MSTNSMMKVMSMMYDISSQLKLAAKMRAIVVYPKAQVTCTPTPYRALDFPKQISLINEKHSVIAGFVPKPMRKRPRPIMLGESAMQVIITATVPIPQATLSASLRP
jgi:hypothetical protein